MQYLDFLKALLALGPKLPAILALVEHIVADVQEIISLVSGGPFAAAPRAVVTSEEMAAENEIVAAITAGGESRGIGDGTFLRAIWAFIESHPELLTLILSLLTKK